MSLNFTYKNLMNKNQINVCDLRDVSILNSKNDRYIKDSMENKVLNLRKKKNIEKIRSIMKITDNNILNSFIANEKKCALKENSFNINNELLYSFNNSSNKTNFIYNLLNLVQ